MLFPLRSLASARLIRRLALLLSLSLAFSAPLPAQSTNTATATAGAASASQSATSDPSLPPPAGVPLPPLPERDEDQDGLTYAEEKQRGSDPTIADTDGDGVLDLEDGWPREQRITLPPLPPVRYALFSLRDAGLPATVDWWRCELAENGTIFYQAPIMENGVLVTNRGTTFNRFDLPTGASVVIDDELLEGLNYSEYLALSARYGALFHHSHDRPDLGSGYLFRVGDDLEYEGRYQTVRFFPLGDDSSYLASHWTGTEAIAAAVDANGVLNTHSSFSPIPYPSDRENTLQIARKSAANPDGDFVTFEIGHWTGQRYFYAGVERGRNVGRHAATFLHRQDGSRVKLGSGVTEEGLYNAATDELDYSYSGSLLYPTQLGASGLVAGFELRGDTEAGRTDNAMSFPAVWDGALHTSPYACAFRSVPGHPALIDSRPEHPAIGFSPMSTAPGIQWIFLEPPEPPVWQPVRFWNAQRQQEVDLRFADVNQKLEIISDQDPVIVRNQVATDLRPLVRGDWDLSRLRTINNHGTILAAASRKVDADGQPIPPAQWVREPVLLFPFELTSEDRLLKGSLRIPEGWSDVSLSLRSTADNGLDLGTFAKLEPGAADSPTYIYASETDVLSDDEFEQAQDGTLDPRAASQPVVFYRDTEDPRRLHFATAFDQAGEVEIALTFGPAAQRVTAKLTHTLVAQAEAAGLIATLDQRIESIDIPEVIDFDVDLDGDGIPDGGSSDLIVASQPGTPSAPGPSVSEQDEDDPDNLVLLANTDDDDFDGVTDHLHTAFAASDDDLARIVLRAPADLATAVGKLTLTHTGGAALRLRLDTGPPVSSGASVDLAAPSGPLAQLSVGLPLVLYAEGLAPASDLTITLAYTPAGQSLPTVTDAVHLHVVDPDGLAALQTRHRYFARPGDLGGIFARSYAANGAYRQHRLGLAPIGENQPLQNRGLLAKALLPVIGNLKITGAYYRGAADGFWMGIKSDWQGLQDVGGAVGSVLAFYFVEDNAGRIARVKALADQLREIKQAFDGVALRDLPGIMKQMATTITRDLYTDAEAALGWEPIIPGLDPQVVAYMAGVTTGFVGEQVLVALIPGGAATKIGPILRQVVLAAKNGTRFALAALESSSKAGSWVYRSIQKALNSVEEARDALQGVQRAKRAALPAGRVNPVVAMSNRLRTRPELFDEILDIWNEWLPRPVTAEQIEALTRNYARLLELAPGPTDLSDDALKGWARFYGSIGTGPKSTRFTEDLVNVFGGPNNFDKAEFNAVMKQLSNVGHNGFRLTLASGSTSNWVSPAGALYTVGSKEGHGITHILTHFIPNYKGNHSVFSFSRSELFATLDEAWTKPRLVAYRLDGSGIPDPGAFVIDMERPIGTSGELHIRFAFSGNRIISAYPFFP